MAADFQCLLCQVGASYLAIPICHVLEVSRPLAITRLPDAPDWVSGVSVLRGVATPVVDARKLFLADDRAPASTSTAAARWVALRIDERRVALAVDAVLRPHAVSFDQPAEVPRLLAASPAITALGTLDSKLLMVLEGTRLPTGDDLAGLDGYAAGR
jgi:purine-binding chemotaxis protein CheW